MSAYLITGVRGYREHPRGDTVEMRLDEGAERRAIARGDIELLERSEPTIQPGTWELPAGWPTIPRKQEDEQCPSASR